MALLDGRRTLVTGASAGLGFGIAQELTVRGARVLMCSRSPQRIQGAAARIAAHMKQAELVPGVAGRHTPRTLAVDVTDLGAAAPWQPSKSIVNSRPGVNAVERESTTRSA